MTVCTVRLRRWNLSWLSTRLRMIGTGKPHRSEYRLSFTVFQSIRSKFGARKKRSNHFQPTHGLPVMPRPGL